MDLSVCMDLSKHVIIQTYLGTSHFVPNCIYLAVNSIVYIQNSTELQLFVLLCKLM